MALLISSVIYLFIFLFVGNPAEIETMGEVCRVSVGAGELHSLVTLTGLLDVSSGEKSVFSSAPPLGLNPAGLCTRGL